MMMRHNILSGLLLGSLSGRGCMVGFASLATIGWMAAPALAQRADYTPSQFISVLNGLGYPVAVSDPIDAPNVRQAMRDFQLQFNLPVTGTMTAASQDRAASVVRSLQQGLNRSLKPATLLPGSQYYGTQTETLVKQFQERNRLPVTGIATMETRQRLAQELAAVGTPIVNPAPQPIGAAPIGSPPIVSPNGSSIIPPLPNTVPVGNSPNPLTPNPLAPSILPPVRNQPVAPVAPAPVIPPVKPTGNVKFGTLYTEPQIRRVLQGIGYDINPQKFLSDSSAVVAIQDFQARYGLALTGTADQPTQEMARTILRGLQYNLRLALGRPLALTELYDQATESAVREFQQRNQLRVDGMATISVRRAIDMQAKQPRP
jgi:peptidoglycan hydrolase-like protein with peptidoglycan-binding domain